MAACWVLVSARNMMRLAWALASPPVGSHAYLLELNIAKCADRNGPPRLNIEKCADRYGPPRLTGCDFAILRKRLIYPEDILKTKNSDNSSQI
jgi:hypothetical protein